MARNPQGNSVIEAIHKSVGQVLRTLVHVHNPQTVHQAKAVGDIALATTMHATCCASHQALHHLTPGSFAFHWDMFFDLPFLTDIIALQNTHQQLVDSCLLKENSSRIKHDYKNWGSSSQENGFVSFRQTQAHLYWATPDSPSPY